MNDQATGLKISDQIGENPFGLFKEWLSEAEKSEPNDPDRLKVGREPHVKARMQFLALLC